MSDLDRNKTYTLDECLSYVKEERAEFHEDTLKLEDIYSRENQPFIFTYFPDITFSLESIFSFGLDDDTD